MPTPREKVLGLVRDIVNLCLPNLHICVTSRLEIDIQTILEPFTPLHVSLHNQSGQKKDIVDYVSHVVCSDFLICGDGAMRTGGLLSGHSPKRLTECK
jgi:hypothetical protein